MLRHLPIIALTCASLLSCKKEQPSTTPEPSRLPPTSQTLREYFPLLPLIEKDQWLDLTTNEKILHNPSSTPEQIKTAQAKINHIATTLKANYPFTKSKDKITLGKITFIKATRQIEIPATVHYPKSDDTRHPGEIELILCTDSGRSHETLFTTTARPLHLELLLHLTGYTKNYTPSTFTIAASIPNSPPIPIHQLLATKNEPLPSPLLWEFSGSNFSDFSNLYSPDQTGDLIIAWHAHPSVLRSNDQNIANGQTKLTPIKNKNLPQNTPVKLILIPAK